MSLLEIKNGLFVAANDLANLLQQQAPATPVVEAKIIQILLNIRKAHDQGFIDGHEIVNEVEKLYKGG